MRTREEQEAINQACKYHLETRDELIKLVHNLDVNLGDIDTSEITNMQYLFFCSEREDFSGIEKWDISKVTDMSGMFLQCTAFNQPIGDWDVSKVENMIDMFDGCKNFNQPLNNWDVSNVKIMNSMFWGCSAFNQPLNDWNVSNVEDMNLMFRGCKTFNQDLNDWDVSNVKDMTQMFAHCEKFNQPLNDWNVREDCDTHRMFTNTSQTYENVKDSFSEEQLLDSGSEKIFEALNNKKEQIEVQEQKVTKGRGR